MNFLLISQDDLIISAVQAYCSANDDTLSIAADASIAKNLLRFNDAEAVLMDCGVGAGELISLAGELHDHLVDSVVLLIGPFDHQQRELLSQRLSAQYSIDKPLRGAAFTDAMNRLKMRVKIVRSAGLIGRSESMEETIQTIIQIAPTPISVLITGESGTGKEVVARAVHAISSRADKPFFAVNCASLAEGILESELFGHEKGAFTGAAGRRTGMFEKADGGTIFLDEIGEITASTQIRLLRVLEEREIMRVGGTSVIPVDVRVIAATNRELHALVENGQFRRDLYYRIKVLEIFVAPLRERPEDIPLLIDRLSQLYAKANGIPVRLFDKESKTYLSRLPWAGNVRELRNFVESCLALTNVKTISLDAIPGHLIRDINTATSLPVRTDQSSEQFERELLYRTIFELKQDIAEIKSLLREPRTDSGIGPKEMEIKPVFHTAETLEDMERDAIADALAQTDGNRRKAARILGIGERTLYRKLNEYGLK